jgi:hypothetical protein
MMRSPMDRISCGEYGVNGPSTALTNSASSSGLSVSKSNGLFVSSQTCLSPVGQDDNCSLMRFGNQFGQLSLSFTNGQCFHDVNLR